MSEFSTRQPSFAGTFYPADKEKLSQQIKSCLNKSVQKINTNIKAVMVPHAGYIFSGDIAGLAYSRLKGRKYENIFLLSNSHTAYFENISLDAHEIWETPLGRVEVNREIVKSLSQENFYESSFTNHLEDHTLEVQLPFLQTKLENFKIIPVMLGHLTTNYKKLANVLYQFISERDLLIISSDMSHYPSYEDAKKIDRRTLEIIKSLDCSALDKYVKDVMKNNIPGEETLLCGIDAVKLVMEIAKKKKWQAEILGYENSGDKNMGGKDKVVGYGSVMFTS